MKYGKRVIKMPALNGRFGVMAAVTPRTILCGNERLYPAGSVVGAAAAPSRWDVVRYVETTVRIDFTAG